MKSLQLSAFAIAFAAAASVGAQPSGGNDTGGAPANSKQAEYDCSGMTWIALDNCLRLNADNARAGSTSVVTPPRGGAHDCSGMIGAPLETCLKLNAQTEALGARSSGRATTGVVESEREQRVQPEPGAQR
ncbi:MAG TPA: hypothetical protein VGR42_11030 [Casimicrobiaceae bacterium]|jgi:hypothetical protein|nr:hypothetical protein [Casimicrobiaceae bacterium]